MLPKRKYISAFFPLPGQERTRSGNKVEMKRKNISALFPRRKASKNSFEVLRLGLGRDPIRELPTGSMPPNCIGLSIGALPLECLQGRFGRRHGGNARHPKAAMRCRPFWRNMDRTHLPDAGVLEDWLEAFAGHFDFAEGITEAQQAGAFEELGLVEPMVGHKAPRSIGR